MYLKALGNPAKMCLNAPLEVCSSLPGSPPYFLGAIPRWGISHGHPMSRVNSSRIHLKGGLPPYSSNRGISRLGGACVLRTKRRLNYSRLGAIRAKLPPNERDHKSLAVWRTNVLSAALLLLRMRHAHAERMRMWRCACRARRCACGRCNAPRTPSAA